MRNIYEIALFVAIIALWSIMSSYTVSYWLLNGEMKMDGHFDISAVTAALLAISLINMSVWIAVYLIYPFVANKWMKRQQLLIDSNKGTESNKMSPLVSIIIPARNEENVIRRTISNCLQQIYRNVEVIVVCHNCSDKTYEQACTNDKRVRVFDLNNSPSGKGIALNFGLDKANGAYICIVDSDGRLAPDFIQNILPLFDLGYAAVQGKIEPSNRKFNLITRLLGLESDLFSYPYMIVRDFLSKRTPLGGTGFVIKRDILINEGRFSNGLVDDFQLSFKLFRRNYRIAFAPLSVVYDEKPPTLHLLFSQRSRWVKGHIDLLNEKTAEFKDLMGIIYWLSPVSMIAGFCLIGVTSFAIIHLLLFGYYPYAFTYLPVKIWLLTLAITFLLQLYILFQKKENRNLREVANTALLIPFSQYWYVVLLKSFFVKSWANTKTPHGFDAPETEFRSVNVMNPNLRKGKK